MSEVNKFEAMAELLHWDSSSVVAAQKQRKWVVQDFLGADSIGWLYGEPGSFKSFAALDIAMCVATGKPWKEREVDAGAVLYIAAEGGDDLHVRRQAWAKHFGTDGPLKILNIRPQIDEVKAETDDYGLPKRPGFNHVRNEIQSCHEALEDYLHYEFLEEYRYADIDDEIRMMMRPVTTGERDRLAELKQQKSSVLRELAKEAGIPSGIKLVVIDTFAQTAADDTKDVVNRYTRALRDLLEEHLEDAAILVVDHTTKGGDTWMGSQAKLGNVDMMASCEAKGDIMTISMGGGRGKIKAAPAFADIHLRMAPQDVGDVDAYGRLLTTLVCLDGSKEKRLAELASSDGVASYVTRIIEAAGGAGIDRSELRTQFGALPLNEGKRADTVGKNMRRAITSLLGDGILEENDGILTMA